MTRRLFGPRHDTLLQCHDPIACPRETWLDLDAALRDDAWPACHGKPMHVRKAPHDLLGVITPLLAELKEDAAYTRQLLEMVTTRRDAEREHALHFAIGRFIESRHKLYTTAQKREAEAALHTAVLAYKIPEVGA